MSIIRGKVYAWHDVDNCVHIRGKKSESFDIEEWEENDWQTEIIIPEDTWREIIIKESKKLEEIRT